MRVQSLRQSAILIPEGNSLRVYHSLEELPWRLRAWLSDPGWEYATILIADRRGRQEIAKALRGQPSALRFHSLRQFAPPRASSGRCRHSAFVVWLATGAGLVLLAAVAWALWPR